MVDLARPSLSSSIAMRAPMAYHSCESTDPDTDFAYLSKKLSLLLGDAQKAFEGEGFADKLGSMGGGYGSFLPTRTRDHPDVHQDFRCSNTDSTMFARRDALIQKAKTKPSILDGNRDDYVDVIDDVVVDDDDDGGGDDGHSHPSGQALGGILNGINADNANNTVDNSLMADDVVKHAVVPQKKVVLRIKIGSESDQKRKNSTVYSEFGLCNSSSSCDDDGENEDENGISDFGFDFDSSPEKSPMSIIRVMTLGHIPDGRLLSPSLPDLVEENVLQKERLGSDKSDYRNLVKMNVGIFEGHGVQNGRRLSKKDESQNLIKADVGRNESGLDKGEGVKVEHSAEKGHGNSKSDNKRSFNHESKKVESTRDKGRSSIDSGKHPKLSSKSCSSKIAVNRVKREATDAVMSDSDGTIMSQGKLKLDKGLSKHEFQETDHMQKGYCSPFESQNNAMQRVHKVEKPAPSASQDSSMFEPFGHIVYNKKDVLKEASPSLESGMIKKRPLEADTELVRQGKRRSSLKGNHDLYEDATNLSPCEKRKTLKSSNPWNSGELVADLSVSSREAYKDATDNREHWKDPLEEAYTSRGPAKYRGKEHPKEAWKNSTKDKDPSQWGVSKDALNMESSKEALENSSKSLNKGIQEKCSAKSLRIEITELRKEEKLLKEKVEPRLPKKDASRLYEQSLKESALQDMLRSEQMSFQAPACTQINSSSGHLDPVSSDPLPALGVLITENWVLCDKCEQWRLLPSGVANENLPKKWSCKMLDWLQPGMNNCSIPEETTTEATRVLNHNLQASIPVEKTSTMPSLPLPQEHFVEATVPSAIRNAGQVTKVIDKNRVATGKKRKVHATPSNENISSKCDNDGVKIPDDDGHVNRAIQEVHQVQSRSVDSGHAQAAEEVEVKGLERRKERAKARDNKDRERMNNEMLKQKKLKQREKKANEMGKQRQETQRPKAPCPSDFTIPIIGKERGQSTAVVAIQEAMNLMQRAEQLNGKIGMENEGTNLYLQAALKFLQAASMLEARDGEFRNEILSIKTYSDTAKLFEFCAENYESRKDFVAAALAYKCAGLAHMRVVQAKSSAIIGDKAEMMSFGGESLNSSLAKDKRGPSSSSHNHQMGDSLIVPEKSRSSLFRVLQYVESTTAAVEAMSKSSNAFNACKDSMNSSKGLDAMKKVLDMGFHDVESLIWFARVALEATGH